MTCTYNPFTRPDADGGPYFDGAKSAGKMLRKCTKAHEDEHAKNCRCPKNKDVTAPVPPWSNPRNDTFGFDRRIEYANADAASEKCAHDLQSSDACKNRAGLSGAALVECRNTINKFILGHPTHHKESNP